MSKYFNKLVIGIDVDSTSSVATILSPTGEPFKKAFRFTHTLKGFKYFLTEIKKAEKKFCMKPITFMESTGVYHSTLFYFLIKNDYEAFIINPLITNCNKNKNVRKHKSDKSDSLAIAKLAKYEDIKAYSYFDISIFTLKALCRDYYKLIDTRTTFKLKLNADLGLIFPGYNKVFSDKASKTSFTLLKAYQTPQSIIDAPRKDILEILSVSRQSENWCNKIYDKLISLASEAVEISIPSSALSVRILNSISVIESLNKQIDILLNEIKTFANSDDVPQSFRDNISYIRSIGGIGILSAITILSEIGDIRRFKKPKQLVAFLGVDPSVNQSGKFIGDRNKMSKRGSRLARRVLFTIILSVIKKKSNGEFSNQSLYEYYHKLIITKKKKVSMIAVMHKMIKYIFAVLRNQKPYVHRPPEIHKRMFLENTAPKPAA